MKVLDQENCKNYVTLILDVLRGLSYHNTIIVLSAALTEYAVSNNDADRKGKPKAQPETPVDEISDVVSAFRYLKQTRKVPKRIVEPDPYEPVWKYLETIETYTTIAELRKQLIEKFGEEAVPRPSKLCWYINANKEPQQYKSQVLLYNINYIARGQGHLSIIEKDPEIQEFISSLDRYYPIAELSVMIEQRFGKDRTPSTSSLHRYLQKISKKLTHIKSEGNHDNK